LVENKATQKLEKKRREKRSVHEKRKPYRFFSTREKRGTEKKRNSPSRAARDKVD